jgi:mycothiol synthase
MRGMEHFITQHNALTQNEVAEVKELIAAVAIEDGMSPLGEHVLIHLHHGGDDDAIQLLARNKDNLLIGYLHLDITDSVAGPAVEVAVQPEARGQGLGTALVKTAETLTNGQPIRLWAHGTNTTAHYLANALGYAKVRELWQMRRSLFISVDPCEILNGIKIRNFVIGQDEDAWLAANKEIFAQHPDQGSWTTNDLQIRISESWFDPAGFFLATDENDNIIGFNWTKIHGGHKHGDHQHPEIGEIYVLGVKSEVAGSGLGRALTIRGLEYLREHGLPAVMLYVEAENERAITLYESVGFTHWDTDIMFREK